MLLTKEDSAHRHVHGGFVWVLEVLDPPALGVSGAAATHKNKIPPRGGHDNQKIKQNIGQVFGKLILKSGSRAPCPRACA